MMEDWEGRLKAALELAAGDPADLTGLIALASEAGRQASYWHAVAEGREAIIAELRARTEPPGSSRIILAMATELATAMDRNKRSNGTGGGDDVAAADVMRLADSMIEGAALLHSTQDMEAYRAARDRLRKEVTCPPDTP